MPIFNRFWLNEEKTTSDPERMRAHGPALQVEVGLPTALAEAVEKAGQPIPAPVSGLALIDTGASITAVDRAMLRQLNLTPVDQLTVSTPSGEEVQDVYPCRMTFPGTPIPPLDLNRVAGSQPIPGFMVLVGRDLLRHFLLVYDGVHGLWTLAF